MPRRQTRSAAETVSRVAPAKRRPTPELAPTLTIAARALYDHGASALKARGHSLRKRTERNDLATVCWILAQTAACWRMIADESPAVRRKGAKSWKTMEKMLLVAAMVMSRCGWVDAKGHPGELEELFGIRRLLPHLKRRRQPRRPGPPGGRAA